MSLLVGWDKALRGSHHERENGGTAQSLVHPTGLNALAVLDLDHVQPALLLHLARPAAARSSSPAATGRVQGQHPMLG